ncbi:MAG TPA: hypothetical protein VK928_05795 [Longimicrobiales bacterium]|nr:hypothetical protein [Longimicrobiales bacterium]
MAGPSDARRLLAALLAAALLAAAAWVATQRAPTPATAPTVAPAGGDVSAAVQARLADLSRRVAQDPDDTVSLRELARLTLDAHRPGEAVDHYRRYVRLTGGNRAIMLELAGALGVMARWTEAELIMQELLQRHPDDGTVLYNLGAIAANRADTMAARMWLGRAAAQDADAQAAQRAREALARLGGGP